MRAGYFWWLQQKRCNELLHLWGMILPLCHRSFQFSPALAGAFASAVAAFLFSVFERPAMLLHIWHFNSCSLREERSTWYLYKMNVATFQFSLPVWGAIDSRCQLVQQGSISILAPCLGSDITEFLLQVLQLISILASCVGSDITEFLLQVFQLISILVPCVGSDGNRGIYIIGNHKFQFSLPVWGAILF